MDVCKLFNRFVYFAIEKLVGNVKNIDPYVVMKLVALWAGRVCLLVFVTVLSIVTYVISFLIIPYEYSISESTFYFYLRICVFIFVYYNIVFHYYKARTLKPVQNPGRPGDKFCVSCNNWKGPSTSHCKACDQCIYRIDHHCPHIGQCVGAHNQANFFLFLIYLLMGTGLYFAMAPSFWWKFAQDRKALLDIPPEQCWTYFCVNKVYILFFTAHSREDQAVKFTALLFLILHMMMWGFVCAYLYVISVGVTMAMKMFQKSDAESVKKFTLSRMIARWRKYFNCRDEQLWTVFLIPRTRKIVVYEDYRELIL